MRINSAPWDWNRNMKTEPQSIAGLLALHCHLHGVSDSPQLDCQVILGHILDKSRAWLLANDEYVVDACSAGKFIAQLKRRQAGEPVAYLTGIKEFWSLELQVTPDTLIPRPETELLVETALERIADDHRTVADLGTGSGAIAIALATERPAWSMVATDISGAALKVARLNAGKLGCKNIEFIAANWCAGLEDYRFDLIVSNPPYVEPDDPHLGELTYEPAGSLVANDHGMADLKTIIRTAPQVLKPGGLLIVEHGYNQQDAVLATLRATGYRNIESKFDAAGHPRSTIARAPR